MKFIEDLKKHTIILFFITVIVLYFVLKDDFSSTVKALQNLDWIYIIIAFFFYAFSVFIRAYINYRITNNKKKITLREALKHNIITQFFNGVTPFSTGGQPMEIYMLTEHDISVASATNQVVQSFLFYQIALVACGVIAIIYNFFFPIFPTVKVLRYFVLLGFIINTLVVIGLILVSSSKKIGEKILKGIVKILKKLKIKVSEKNLQKKIEDYYNGFQEMKKRKGFLTMGVLGNVVSLLCLYAVPIFILYAMHDFSSLNIVETLVASAYVYIMGSFIPIPGASGGIEYGFTQFFGNFISISKIAAVVLVWRFITYYLGIIIGAIVFNLERR